MKNRTLSVKSFLSIKTPKFSDYAALKAGRDTWSTVKLPSLLDALKAKGIEAELPDGYNQVDWAKTCRWCLRGLPYDKAIRKVQVDREITENAQKSFLSRDCQ